MIWCKARYHSAVSIISKRKFNKIKREKKLSGLLLFLGVSVALVQLAIKLCIYSVLVVSLLVFANQRESSTYWWRDLRFIAWDHIWQFSVLCRFIEENSTNSKKGLSGKYKERWKCNKKIVPPVFQYDSIHRPYISCRKPFYATLKSLSTD